MRPENKRMQEFLKVNGIKAVPWYIFKGSMKGCWRIYNKDGQGWAGMEKWTLELAEKLNGLGFKGYDGQPLGQLSGNGGSFMTFVRGHYELLNEPTAPTPITKTSAIDHDRVIRRQLRLDRAARTNDRNCKRNGSPMYY